MSEKTTRVGQRVEVPSKDTFGTIAFVGSTNFSSGKWIGVILDEKKGKNNGTVQGKSYFQCEEGFGTFLRQSQVIILDDDDDEDASSDTTKSSIPSTATTPILEKPKSRIWNRALTLFILFLKSALRGKLSLQVVVNFRAQLFQPYDRSVLQLPIMGRLSLKRGISLVSPTLSSYSPSAFSDSSTYYTPKTPSRFADFQFPNSEQELSRESLTKPLENHSFLTPLSDINKTNNLHSKNQKTSIPSDFCYSLPDCSHISESNLTKYSSVVDIDEANSNQSLVNLPHSSIKKSNYQKSIIKTPKFARKGSQEATEISNSKSIKLDSDGVSCQNANS
ncbi:Dynactin subunit 1 [Armadillidium vulgare]|nr:Dynactin subunit 1 [Armadillidium vulgare]